MTTTLREPRPTPPSRRPTPPPQDGGVSVRREVWPSLFAMLRVYAYAASLSHGEIVVIETAPYAALLEYRGHTLVLSLDPGSGQGRWHLPGAKKGSEGFEILDDGRLRLAGVERQLDEAAIDWVEELTRAAAQGEAG